MVGYTLNSFGFIILFTQFLLFNQHILLVSASCARLTTFDIVSRDNASLPINMPFGYSPTNGPLLWHQLKNGQFKTCAVGKRQSPIDITTNVKMNKTRQIELGRNRLQWFDNDFKINFAILPEKDNSTYALENIGTTLEISNLDIMGANEKKALTLFDSYSIVNGTKYNMKQIHFHSPSEHKINGISYPLEAHIVHQNKETGRAFVLAILFHYNLNTGSTTDAFSEVFRLAPKLMKNGAKSAVTFNKSNLQVLTSFLEKQTKWVYRGSFTTPPCTEDVSWLVVSEPIRISYEDGDAMNNLLKGNSRYTQTRLGQENSLAISCAKPISNEGNTYINIQ